MKKIAVIIIVTALLVSLGGIGGSTALPLGGPSKTTPSDIPVMKLPKDLDGGPSIPAGNPHGEPPGLAKKPKPPEDPDPDPGPNKWAVVIGIADYKGRSSDLWHPDEDAKEMASALKENYGFADSNIKVLLNRDAKAAAILSAIDWLVQNEDSESTVVFFFSGHGFRLPDSSGWDDDNEDDGKDECIVSHDLYGLTDGLLKQKFDALESDKIALAFGSCHSGGMFDDDDDLQGANRVIASACKADQYAWDYLLLGNTLWGKYFVDEGLLQGMADSEGNGDGDSSVEEAHDYAYPRVVSVQSDSQPQMYDNYAGQFVP